MYFISILAIFSIGMTQLNILLSIGIEQSFSPLESEESFPLIESAEPIGGIAAGILAFIGSTLISPKTLLLIWAAIIASAFIIICIQQWIYNEESIPSLLPEKKTQPLSFRLGIKIISENKLILFLFLFVLLQSSAYLFIELIYSISASVLFAHSNNGTQDIVIQELAHGIGLFHITVYAVLLVIQVLFASKIQHSLGVAKTMFIQPFVLIIASFLSLFSGSYWTGTIIKGMGEIAGGVSKNSYHSSFYSFAPSIRENTKELLEGVARPVGMFFSALLLILLSGLTFLQGWNFEGFYMLCLGLLCVISISSIILYRTIKAEYTKLAILNIHGSHPVEEKFDAIEILAQKGHENTISLLSHVLRNEKESIVIKKKVLESFGQLQENDALPDILWALDHENKEIQLSAVNALGKYDSLQKYFTMQVFSRHKIISALQNVFLQADSKKLRLAVIHSFQKMHHKDIAPFLIESLTSENTDTAFCAILGCSSFKDISIAFYLRPLMKSKDPFIKSASIIALHQFDRYRPETNLHIKEMIESEEENMIMSGMYTAGEVKETKYLQKIITIIENHESEHVKKHGLIALIKMGKDEYIPQILEMIFHNDVDISSSTKKLLFSPSIDTKLTKHIKAFIRKKVIEEIHTLLQKHKNIRIHKYSQEVLQKLLTLYNLIEEEKSAWAVQRVLEEKYPSC